MLNVINTSMVLFTFPTGLYAGTKSESSYFGINEIEGNWSPAALAVVGLLLVGLLQGWSFRRNVAVNKGKVSEK